MISVVLLGSGNVVKQLSKVLLDSEDVDLVQIYARSPDKIAHLKGKTNITNNINTIEKASVYIIAVTDDAIVEVASKLPKDCFVVHTSGATAMDDLGSRDRRGVFYMLQSFSSDKEIDFKKVPFCLEASNKIDLLLLEDLASIFGGEIYSLTSAQRQYLHVSAVFVNNFVNHMYKTGYDICFENDIPFDILRPLIEETSSKLSNLKPKDAQTGPAIRGDNKTITKHLELLSDDKKELYNLITKSIKK